MTAFVANDVSILCDWRRNYQLTANSASDIESYPSTWVIGRRVSGYMRHSYTFEFEASFASVRATCCHLSEVCAQELQLSGFLTASGCWTASQSANM